LKVADRLQRAIDLGFTFFSGRILRLHESGLGGESGEIGTLDFDRRPLLVSGCPDSVICTAMIAVVPV
jgi:hypothetical protein